MVSQSNGLIKYLILLSYFYNENIMTQAFSTKGEYFVYSANDIAKILVRNPSELTDLLTYGYMCEHYARDRAFEDLSKAEHDALLSVEAAVEELRWLGFRDNQINILLDSLNAALNHMGIENMQPDIGIITVRERFEMAAFTAVAFPYGPPLVLSIPAHALKDRGFSLSRTQSLMHNLTSRVAAKIFDARVDHPYLLTTIISPEMAYRLDNPHLSL